MLTSCRSNWQVPEDYVCILDTDMLLRRPFLPPELRVHPGHAASAACVSTHGAASAHLPFSTGCQTRHSDDRSLYWQRARSSRHYAHQRDKFLHAVNPCCLCTAARLSAGQ